MSAPYYQDERAVLHHGDCLDVLAAMPDASVDAIVTDPPYGLEFMGKEWDAPWKASSIGRGVCVEQERAAEMTPTGVGHSTSGGPYLASRVDSVRVAGLPFQQWCEAWARECLRILKPGGHLLAFGGTRTWHRLACAVEDAGFEMRDSIAWVYGQGFPKSMNPGNDKRFCQCAAVESKRGDDDLRGVRTGVSDLAADSEAGEVADVLAPVQREGAGSPVGDLRAPRTDRQGHAAASDVRCGESGMEGRGDLQAAEGQLRGSALREVPGGSALHGEGGRLRDGAPARDGSLDRATAGPDGSSEPHQPQPAGQPTGEPGAVPEQRGSQAGRGGPVCAGCGKPPAPVGLGTALKPAFEPVVVARKPLAGTVAANILAHGTGALNIDGCRVEAQPGDYSHPGNDNRTPRGDIYGAATQSGRQVEPNPSGRWPANVALDESQADALDRQSGTSESRIGKPRRAASGDVWGMTATGAEYADSGGASRFFFVCKGDTMDACGNASTAEPSSSQQSARGDSAPSDAATSASLADNSSSRSTEPSMSATATESRQRGASDTQAILSTAPRCSPESRQPRHTPTSSPARNAEPSEPTGTTTTTQSRSKSAGSAAPATFSTTPKQAERGVRALPLDALNSRFIYTAKAPSAERPRVDGVAHPTVKPLDLMRWLVRLVTPPGGLVLDPFAGSGTTGEAAIVEGFRVWLIEREADYLPLILHRIERAQVPLDFTTEAS